MNDNQFINNGYNYTKVRPSMMIKRHSNLHKIFTNHLPFRKKNSGNKNTCNKNIFNKNGGRCRDIKTQKACEQGWEINIGPKINKPLPHKYSSFYFAL